MRATRRKNAVKAVAFIYPEIDDSQMASEDNVSAVYLKKILEECRSRGVEAFSVTNDIAAGLAVVNNDTERSRSPQASSHRRTRMPA